MAGLNCPEWTCVRQSRRRSLPSGSEASHPRRAKTVGSRAGNGITNAGTPVFVRRLDGHMALANSLALKRAGVTRETKDPAGGLIVRDAKTGMAGCCH